MFVAFKKMSHQRVQLSVIYPELHENQSGRGEKMPLKVQQSAGGGGCRGENQASLTLAGREERWRCFSVLCKMFLNVQLHEVGWLWINKVDLGQ